jgi:hypothetical protein
VTRSTREGGSQSNPTVGHVNGSSVTQPWLSVFSEVFLSLNSNELKFSVFWFKLFLYIFYVFAYVLLVIDWEL